MYFDADKSVPEAECSSGKLGAFGSKLVAYSLLHGLVELLLLTLVWQDQVRYSSVTFLLKYGLSFTTTSLEKSKVYVHRNFFAWEILGVIGHVYPPKVQDPTPTSNYQVQHPVPGELETESTFFPITESINFCTKKE